MDNMKPKTKGSFILVLTAFIWGLAFVAQSVSMDYVGPFTFLAARNIIGSITLLPLILWGKRKDGIKKTPDGLRNKETPSGYPWLCPDGHKNKETRALLGSGLLCGVFLFLAGAFQQIGIMYTTVGKAGFITALYIIIVPLLGLFFRKPVAKTIWLSVLIALAGMYFLCINENVSISIGDILTLACAVFFSIHILLIDHFSSKVENVPLSCIQFLVCGIISTILAFIFETPHINDLLLAWKPVLYAGVLSSGVAYTLQIIGQKNTDPVVASLILSLESVFSALAGWLILGQSLSAKELAGCMLIFIAIILAQLPGGKVHLLKKRKHDMLKS